MKIFGYVLIGSALVLGAGAAQAQSIYSTSPAPMYGSSVVDESSPASLNTNPGAGYSIYSSSAGAAGAVISGTNLKDSSVSVQGTMETGRASVFGPAPSDDE